MIPLQSFTYLENGDLYSMCHILLPTPEELANDPELAVLVALAQSLEVARVTLLAHYPDLHADDINCRRTHSDLDAYTAAISYQLHALSRTIDEYIDSVGLRRNLQNCNPPARDSQGPAF